jgi:acyl-homoserine-lactone acylase
MRFKMTAALCVTLATGCGDAEVQKPPENLYHVTVRRTSYGIPHIKADTLGSLGFGLGYSGAEDFICTLADQIIKVRSERARIFGPGDQDSNIDSDLSYLALGVYALAESEFPKQPETIRELVTGYAAGYNHYLKSTPSANLPAPCTGAEWVKPITATDLAAYYFDLSLRGSAVPLLSLIANAQPPAMQVKNAPQPVLPDFRHLDLGSNGWALGSDRTESGKGMLLANPHFPWEGELKFYESHLTIPGMLDVYGAGLLGTPVVSIGFNKDVGWTHTVTPASHFTLYKLTLAPGDPTSYMVDGQPRAMTSTEFSVPVKNPDGSIADVSRTFWRTHHGLMVAGSGLTWGATTAFSYRDANLDNVRLGEQWLRMDMATSVDDLKAVQAEVHAIPWVYTMASDKDGKALFIDASRVPNLSPETESAYAQALINDPLTKLVADSGGILLDGSISRDEWVTSNEPNAAGLVPVADAPTLSRSDFVMNANDPPWLANPAEPLLGYPMIYGPARAVPSPRTRMNLVMLTEMGMNAAPGPDGKFSLAELQDVVLSNRGITAEALRAAVVARCGGATTVTVDGQPVDITAACNALSGWDGRYNLDSAGAVLWREFLVTFAVTDIDTGGALYAVPFDPDNPLTTPNTLAPPPAMGDDPILVALGRSVNMLTQAGLAENTTLGDAQFTRKGSTVIPIHGGGYRDGVTNITGFGRNDSTLLPKLEQATVLSPRTGLTSEGYLINNGTSFIMTLEFTAAGPNARAMLSYSESSDPASPHFADQTQLFSDKAWRPALFTEEEIAADPNLTTKVLQGNP